MTNLRVELAANLFTELAPNNYRSQAHVSHDQLKWIAQDCLAMADIFIEELNAEQTKS
jgi:hypothetical protein